MDSYMVVASFKEGITPEDIRALIPAEQAQAQVLKDKGLLGEIKVAMPRRTVFLEAFSETEEEVRAVIESLPFAQIWDLEFYLTTPPAGTV